MAATKYNQEIASDGSKDFTTGANWDTYVVAQWGLTNFDGDVTGTVYDTGDFTDQWTITSTLNPTRKYPLIIKNAVGHSPTIDATGNGYGIFCSSGPIHVRVYGIEVHGSTVANLYFRAYFVYLEDVYSHDCTATADQFLFVWSSTVYAHRCRFEGTGHIYARDACNLHFHRCSFSGGIPGSYMFQMYNPTGATDWRFTSCKIDGSALDAGKPIIIIRLGIGSPQITFINTSVDQGGWLVAPWTAATEVPYRLTAKNNIFANLDAGVFDCAGDYTFQDEGEVYELEANCYYNCPIILKDADGTYTTLAQLQAAGYDTKAKSITSDPKLTIATGTIAANSPCVEAGIGAGVLLGYNGSSFNPYLPSIGADAQHDGTDRYAQRSDWVGEITAATPLDFPARESVLTTDTVNGLAGLWTKADKTKVLTGNDFGVSGSEVASYSPDFPARTSVLTTDTVNGLAGLWTKADRTKVLVTYDFGVAGSEVATYIPDFPARASVLTTDTVNGLDGLWVKADRTKVLVTNDFGVAGSEVATYSPDFPARESVLTTDTVNGLDGLWTKATASRYQRGYAFGANATSEDGGNRLPANIQVVDGVFYGPDDSEEGTFECPGAVVPSGDMLATGGAWLADQALIHLARTVVYKRGAQIVSVSAATGRTDWDVEAEGGVIERIESRDFFVRASDLVLGGVVVTPKRGDIIKETISGTVHLYEVNAPAGEDVYGYGTHGKDILRIHTKHTGEE